MVEPQKLEFNEGTQELRLGDQAQPITLPKLQETSPAQEEAPKPETEHEN